MLSALLLLACLGVAALDRPGTAPGWWSGGPLSAWLGLLLAGLVAHAGLVLGRPRAAAARRPLHPPRPAPVVERAARATWRGGATTEGVLRDISPHGARLAGTAPVAKGTEGVLRVEGIALPVPARVVGWAPSTGLVVAFQLEGLRRDAFLAELGSPHAPGRDRLDAA